MNGEKIGLTMEKTRWHIFFSKGIFPSHHIWESIIIMMPSPQRLQTMVFNVCKFMHKKKQGNNNNSATLLFLLQPPLRTSLWFHLSLRNQFATFSHWLKSDVVCGCLWFFGNKSARFIYLKLVFIALNRLFMMVMVQSLLLKN